MDRDRDKEGRIEKPSRTEIDAETEMDSAKSTREREKGRARSSKEMGRIKVECSSNQSLLFQIP